MKVPENIKYDLIIFGGQSNMQGQTGTPPDDFSVVDGAFEYRFCTDEFVELKPPVGESIDFEGRPFDKTSCKTTQEVLEKAALLSVVTGNANMVPAFCRSYIKKTGRRVVAVHTAKGSTEIDYWQKNTPAYEIMSKKIRGAIKQAHPEHIYFVWLQGESDAIAGKTKNEYKEKLIKLNQALKNDFGVEKFCVILVGRFTMDERDFEIINAQKEVCAENDDFLMLTTITEEIIYKTEYMHATVPGHYNTKGQNLLGKISGNALGEHITNI